MTDNTAALRELRRFSIPGLLQFEEDQHGLLRACITSMRCEAAVYLQGAHVTHWQPRGEDAVLFLSQESRYERGRPIRGGIPIVFPWFGAHSGDPEAPAHGWARLSPWQVAGTRQCQGDVEITLGLNSADIPGAGHPCSLRYRIRAGLALELELQVSNGGNTVFRFEEALHTYLAVRDVQGAWVEGLEGAPYASKVRESDAASEPDGAGAAGPIRVRGEIDRVYQEARPAVTLADPAARRRVVIEKSGSGSTVVWNPWTGKSASMPDFGDDEWRSMLCIETANIGESAVELAPGASHRMTARLKVQH